MSDDLIKRSDAIAEIYKVRTPDVASHQYAELFVNAVCRAPSADKPQKVVAQVTFDEEKLREIVKEAVERFKEEYEITDRPQGEWIPCSERLPKIGEHHISEPCIVYCKCGAYAFAELEENIFGQVGWNCERDDEYHEPIGEVVAWMPLPKPYGESKGE